MKNYIDTMRDLFLRKWDAPAMTDFRGEEFTYKEVARNIAALHKLFDEVGAGKGDRIAICGKNSSHWAMAFLAAETSNCVAVPILYDFTSESVLKLAEHSGSKILFTDSRHLSGMDTSLAKNVKLILCVDDYTQLWSADPSLTVTFSAKGDEFSKKDLDFDSGSLDDLAVINYTSGTTGEPKGVMLTNKNISATLVYSHGRVPVYDSDHSLSMLPLAHMYGLTFEFLYTFVGGSHVWFLGKTPGPTTLMAAFAEVQPFLMITVPLVVDKIVKGKIIPALSKPSVKFLTKIPLVNEIIYAKVRKGLSDALGGKVRMLIMGGAALNPASETILRKIHFPYTVGYGMTECSPLVTYADPKDYQMGSCGMELENCDHLRIDSEDPRNIPGEIQVKGDNVMLGYYDNEAATKAAFTEDGWLRTGDLGVISDDGSLYIRGRCKCMILSSNGQNIYPEELESLINDFPEVEESLVVSREGKLVAMVALKNGVAASIGATLKDAVNKLLPQYSKIALFEIMKEPFIHTPKHSIKRSHYTDLK